MTSPSSERMGVALTRVVTVPPPGTSMTISSARTVSPVLSAWARGNSSREISSPSARRKVSMSRSSSAEPSGMCRPLTILLASRLTDVTPPVFALNTRTPTGVVFTKVSMSALARCSSRCRRALAMTSAAWEANITRVSSSVTVLSIRRPLLEYLVAAELVAAGTGRHVWPVGTVVQVGVEGWSRRGSFSPRPELHTRPPRRVLPLDFRQVGV